MNRFKFSRRYYDGEPDPAPEPDPNPAPAPAPAGGGFTQAQVDAMMAKHKRGLQTKLESLEAQLEQGTSPEQVTELQNTISLLQTDLSSENKKKETEMAKIQKKHSEELAAANSSSQTNYNLYSQFRISQEIQSAAIGEEAFNPEQIFNQLSPNTSLVEIKGPKGESTGDFQVKINLVKVEDGKEEILAMTPSEAIKAMKENPLHANLFKTTSGPGMGSTNNGPGKTGVVSTNMEAYLEQRKESGLK